MGVLVGGERCYEQYIYNQPSALPFCLRRSRQIRTAIGASPQSRGHFKPAVIYNSELRCERSTLTALHSRCCCPGGSCVCCSASAASSAHDMSLSGERAAKSAKSLNIISVMLVLFVGRVALYSALLKLAGRPFVAPTLAAHA